MIRSKLTTKITIVAGSLALVFAVATFPRYIQSVIRKLDENHLHILNSSVENCKDARCASHYLPKLLTWIESKKDRNAGISNSVSSEAEKTIYTIMSNTIKEQEDKSSKYGRTITSLYHECKSYGYFSGVQVATKSDGPFESVFNVDTRILASLSNRIKNTTDRFSKMCELQEKETKLREEEDRKARIKQAEADRKEKQEEEYQKRFLEIIWKYEDTGKLRGKAIAERDRIRKYRSIGNNDMAQAFFKVFNEYGVQITNGETGNEYFEVRFDCDIYSPFPEHIGDGDNFSYYMGGAYSPKEVCAAAGYPRR